MMPVKESWHCTNRLCYGEVILKTESRRDALSPRCSCGAPMLKRYKSPVFRYLDFLRGEQEDPSERVPFGHNQE